MGRVCGGGADAVGVGRSVCKGRAFARSLLSSLSSLSPLPSPVRSLPTRRRRRRHRAAVLHSCSLLRLIVYIHQRTNERSPSQHCTAADPTGRRRRADDGRDTTHERGRQKCRRTLCPPSASVRSPVVSVYTVCRSGNLLL